MEDSDRGPDSPEETTPTELSQEVAELVGEVSEAPAQPRASSVGAAISRIAGRGGQTRWRGIQSGGQTGRRAVVSGGQAGWRGIQSGGDAGRRAVSGGQVGWRGIQSGTAAGWRGIQSRSVAGWHGVLSGGRRAVQSGGQAGRRAVQSGGQAGRRAVQSGGQAGRRAVQSGGQAGRRAVQSSGQAGRRRAQSAGQAGRRTVQSAGQAGRSAVQSGGQVSWRGIQSGGQVSLRGIQSGGQVSLRGIRSAGRWLTGQVIAMAPRLPVRDLERLRAQHPGLSREDLADALVNNASRAAALVGMATGAALVLPLPSAPVEVAVETLVVVGIEIKLVAELHEVYGERAPGSTPERMLAYVGAWAHRRGITFAPAGLILVAGSPLRRRLQRRLLARAGRSALSLGPLLTGAVAGAALNQRETRHLGADVRKDLRSRLPEAAGDWPV
jgi:hypothetical protein